MTIESRCARHRGSLLLLAALLTGCAGSGSAGSDPRVEACKDNFPPYDPARKSCLAGIEASDEETEAADE